MVKPANAIAAAVLLTIAGMTLAWQGQTAWTHWLSTSGQGGVAHHAEKGSDDTENGYLQSGGVPGQALYGWSYPFAFPHDPLAAVQKSNGGRTW